MANLTHWRLDDAECSLLLAMPTARAGLPVMLWWGERLPDVLSEEELEAMVASPVAAASYGEHSAISVLPLEADGYFALPGLLGHHVNDNSLQISGFSPAFELVGADYTSSGLSLTLSDAVSGLQITQDYTLKSSGVLGVCCELSNNSNSAYLPQWLASATVPLPDQHTHCITFNGRWAREFQPNRQPITRSRLQVENRTGRSSQSHAPQLITGTDNFNELEGHVYGMQLAWSGNQRLVIERLDTGQAYVQAGVVFQPGECILNPGQSWQSPELHITVGTGLNQMSQRNHRHLRNNVLPAWTRRPRPVHANSWEALYFDHNEATLIELIDKAAESGAERFVLDDGWFSGRHSDRAGLGDWTVDANKYPDGLHGLVAHTRARGLQFGLWFEPEMVNPDSDLYRQHPEWTLQVQGYPVFAGRNQYVLDLSNADAYTYLHTHLTSLIEEYSIDYIKWDMNRNLVQAGNGFEPVQHQQTTQLYRLLSELQHQFPALEIESCAAGGGRADTGILRHTGRVWTSDNLDPVDRLSIQRHFSLFFPPEIMGSHIGAERAHVTSRVTELDLRAIVALQGQPGIELDARSLSDSDRRSINHYLTLYKDRRHWLNDAICWRLPARTGNLLASGLVAHDQHDSLWTVAITDSTACSFPGRLILQGLTDTATYQLRLLNHDYQVPASMQASIPGWIHTKPRLSGKYLMTIGLKLPAMQPQSALLIGCTRQDDQP